MTDTDQCPCGRTHPHIPPSLPDAQPSEEAMTIDAVLWDLYDECRHASRPGDCAAPHAVCRFCADKILEAYGREREAQALERASKAGCYFCLTFGPAHKSETLPGWWHTSNLLPDCERDACPDGRSGRGWNGYRARVGAEGLGSRGQRRSVLSDHGRSGCCRAHEVNALRVVKAFACKCERCEYEWTADVKPDRCASCRSPYWNIKRGELRRGRPPAGAKGKGKR